MILVMDETLFFYDNSVMEEKPLFFLSFDFVIMLL